MTDRLGIRREIRSIEFAGDAVVITYCTVPDDLRKTGLLATHQQCIPVDGDYTDEIEDAREAIQALLNDALEDMARLEPYDPADDEGGEEDDDDDES